MGKNNKKTRNSNKEKNQKSKQVNKANRFY